MTLQRKDNQMKNLSFLTSALLLCGTALCAQTQTPGAHFLANWDADGDGIVTLDEATTKRDAIFAAFDAGGDGSLSAEEYALFDEARANDQAEMRAQRVAQGGGKGMGMNEEGGMVRAFNDTNADGLVSKQEFMSRTAAWVTRMDRNADGKVTVEDFGKN
jgi:hypothetical protein